ncbi:MAG: hypothetical protein D6814_16390, partial [Calditrichaeota bacterium]
MIQWSEVEIGKWRKENSMKRSFAIGMLLLLSTSILFAQEPPPPPGGPPPMPPEKFGIMGFPGPLFAQPGDKIDLPIVFFAPVPADSQLSEIAFSLRTRGTGLTFDAQVDTTHTALSQWQLNVSVQPDSIRFTATAPAGTYFIRPDSMMPDLLALFHGSIDAQASEGDSIEIEILDASLKGKNGVFLLPDSLLMPGKVFIGNRPPGGEPGVSLFRLSHAKGHPGELVRLNFILQTPVPADSQLSRIRGTLRATPGAIQWQPNPEIIDPDLSNWSILLSVDQDRITFDLNAPDGQYLVHDSPDSLPLFPIQGIIGQVEPGTPGIAIVAEELFLTLHGQEIPVESNMLAPGFIELPQDSMAPPPPGDFNAGLIGFPPIPEVNPGQKLTLPVVFFAPTPADSQVTGFKLSLVTDYPHATLDGVIDTSFTALQNWTFASGGQGDSIWVEATAPAGKVFSHSEQDEPAMLFLVPLDISPEAAPGDHFEVRMTHASVVARGVEHAIEDSLLGIANINIRNENGGPGPNPGPGQAVFAIRDVSANPGDEVDVEFDLLGRTPPDTVLNRIRGSFKAVPSDIDWLSSGHELAPALKDWSFDVHVEAGEIQFDAVAPEGQGLSYDQDQPLPLFFLRAKVLNFASADDPIRIFPVELYLTINGIEAAFDQTLVVPGKIYPPGSAPPPPMPPMPAATPGDRVNLGLYGGTVLDFAFDEAHGMVIAAVAAPQSVFISADSGQTWTAAFPTDSLEYFTEDITRGFGGRGVKVEASDGYCYAQTSQEAGTLTGAQVSEDGVHWRTLIDAYIIKNLVQQHFGGIPGPMAVRAISTHGPVAVVGSNQYVFWTPDAGNSWQVSAVPDTLSLNPDLSVQTVALRPDDPSGASFYVTKGQGWNSPGAWFYRTDDGVNFTRLFVAEGGDTATAVAQIVVHPQNGDTLWVSTAAPNHPSLAGLWRSYDAGDTWTRLYTTSGPGMSIRLKLYQDDNFTGPDHIRLVMVGENKYSDDLGDNWTDFSPLNDPEVARVSAANAGLGHIPGTDIYFGQGDGAPSRSTDGLEGTYRFVPNGIEGITIWKIAQVPDDPDKVYLATSIGIAYTTKFTDTTVTATAKWAEPDGNFPINPQG